VRGQEGCEMSHFGFFLKWSHLPKHPTVGSEDAALKCWGLWHDLGVSACHVVRVKVTPRGGGGSVRAWSTDQSHHYLVTQTCNRGAVKPAPFG
jgi:hypothetical protein